MAHHGIAILHVGAGYHNPMNVPQYQQACADALMQAVSLLRSGADAALAATEAVVRLEAAACTNAGRGSNLALDGRVECDAGLMVDRAGQGARFAAVGAVPDHPHPIRIAHRMLQLQQQGLSYGREPPNLLVGEGASRWARSQGIVDSVSGGGGVGGDPAADPLVTANSLHRYKKAKRRLHELDELAATASEAAADTSSIPCSAAKKQRTDSASSAEDADDSDRYDTVGAVVIDCAGNIAAAASSGGIMLKYPGRVGQAAVYGCGCWADSAATTGQLGVGSCTSGLGEQLIMSCLARRIAAEVSRAEHTVQGTQLALKRGFIGSHYIPRSAERLAGAVVLRHDPELQAVDLAWSHCSSSFMIGYQSTQSDTPQTLCSRLPPEGTAGSTVLSQGVTLRFAPCSGHQPLAKVACTSTFAARTVPTAPPAASTSAQESWRASDAES